ncbi:hypothetical protein [Streptomyces triticirhizae]|uniref:Uncharacterized protein n=1 Tax=Streptomyces triticirhizae TaxID=2483353 RepID=A0A3M2M5Z6_9ACTN|nr:hypothetical protein [Streptomyces triticirhizae]RMI44420.1 hypothetical protein EBN88_05315 [Streptomyces triticirhizae]
MTVHDTPQEEALEAAPAPAACGRGGGTWAQVGAVFQGTGGPLLRLLAGSVVLVRRGVGWVWTGVWLTPAQALQAAAAAAKAQEQAEPAPEAAGKRKSKAQRAKEAEAAEEGSDWGAVGGRLIGVAVGALVVKTLGGMWPFVVGPVGVTAWGVAAWLYAPARPHPSGPDTPQNDHEVSGEQDQEGDDDPAEEAPRSSPEKVRAATLAWVAAVIGDRNGVHLDELLARAHAFGILRELDTSGLRQALEAHGIPVADGVKIKGNDGKAYNRQGISRRQLEEALGHPLGDLLETPAHAPAEAPAGAPVAPAEAAPAPADSHPAPSPDVTTPAEASPTAAPGPTPPPLPGPTPGDRVAAGSDCLPTRLPPPATAPGEGVRHLRLVTESHATEG